MSCNFRPSIHGKLDLAMDQLRTQHGQFAAHVGGNAWDIEFDFEILVVPA